MVSLQNLQKQRGLFTNNGFFLLKNWTLKKTIDSLQQERLDSSTHEVSSTTNWAFNTNDSLQQTWIEKKTLQQQRADSLQTKSSFFFEKRSQKRKDSQTQMDCSENYASTQKVDFLLQRRTLFPKKGF